MKIFLSAISKRVADYLISRNVKMKWNLLSYWQIKNDYALAKQIKDCSEQVLIDSGAHTFQYGSGTNNIQAFTEKYIEFIQAYDDDKVLGFFEMDVDNIIGLKEVERLRDKLNEVSNKIIPVWHVNRGIEDFRRMCQKHRGKIVAITGFSNKDISDTQYIMFLKTAWTYGCRVHCLGMTRTKILDVCPFDYVDSSTWLTQYTYGLVYSPKADKLIKATRESTRLYQDECKALNYLYYMRLQDHYYRKWKRYDHENNNNWNI